MNNPFQVGDKVEYIGSTYSFVGAKGFVEWVGPYAVDILITEYKKENKYRSWPIHHYSELKFADPVKSIGEFL